MLISNFVGKLFTRAANSISNTGDGKEEFSSGKLNWRCKLHKKGVECFKIFHNDLNDSKKGVDHEPAHGMTQLSCMKYIIRHERERAEGEKIQGKCAASSASDTRIRPGIVKDHETRPVFSFLTGQHRWR